MLFIKKNYICKAKCFLPAAEGKRLFYSTDLVTVFEFDGTSGNCSFATRVKDWICQFVVGTKCKPVNGVNLPDRMVDQIFAKLINFKWQKKILQRKMWI